MPDPLDLKHCKQAVQALFTREEFIRLGKERNRFNIFDVLRITRYEVRHTTFLRYLLDPNESHGLGDIFLRNVLLQLDMVADASGADDTAPARRKSLDVSGLDLPLTQVRSEVRLRKIKGAYQLDADEADDGDAHPARTDGKDLRIDLLLEIPKRSNRSAFVVAIENKIDAKAGDTQLTDYRSALDRSYGKDRALCVFLTVTPDEKANKDGWLSATYDNLVYPALKRTLMICGERLAIEPRLLIEHYLQVLADLVEAEAASAVCDELAAAILKDDRALLDKIRKVKAEAPELYRPYWKEFDFLLHYDTDPRARGLKWFSNSWTKAVTPKLTVEVNDSNRNYLRFLPLPGPASRLAELAHLQALQSDGKKPHWTRLERAILFEIRCYRVGEHDQVRRILFIVVGPLREDIPREKFVNELRDVLAASYGDKRAAKAAGLKSITRMNGDVTPSYSAALRCEFAELDEESWEARMCDGSFLALLGEMSASIEAFLERVGQKYMSPAQGD
jgi:hypothetical protein